MSDRKIGEGHLGAMGRLGYKELTHNILPAFPHQGQHIIEEPGLMGNPTQGEVAQARKGPGSGPEQESPAVEPEPRKFTMEEFRAFAEEAAKAKEHEMTHAHERAHEREHGMER